MSVVRFRPPARPPRVVRSWLIPWEPGIPGIAFLYSDGTQGCADVRWRDPHVLEAIERLSIEDKIELTEHLEAAHAAARARH